MQFADICNLYHVTVGYSGICLQETKVLLNIQNRIELYSEIISSDDEISSTTWGGSSDEGGRRDEDHSHRSSRVDLYLK